MYSHATQSLMSILEAWTTRYARLEYRWIAKETAERYGYSYWAEGPTELNHQEFQVVVVH